MAKQARSPGVLLSVRWGDQALAHEFLPLQSPRVFRIGSAAGCDFTCAGAKSHPLLEIDAEGAALRAPGQGTVQLIRAGQALSEPSLFLEKGDVAQLEVGPLHFEARLLEGPPAVRRSEPAELATVNVALILSAAFGLFVVAAANHDSEGEELSDGLSANRARVVKILHSQATQRASAAASAPKLNAPSKGLPAPTVARARQQPPSRPASHRGPQLEVARLFDGVGANKVFAHEGLGDALAAAASGMRTAQAGLGIGMLGGGHAPSGDGLGGMGLEGIGNLGTHGKAGGHLEYGTGYALTPGQKVPPTLPPPLIIACGEGVGCLDKEIIRRVIRANLPGFRFCFESLLNRFPSLEGKVVMKFAIEPSGRVSTASVVQSTAANPEFEQCLGARTRLLAFPSRSAGGQVLITYPFVFKQSGS